MKLHHLPAYSLAVCCLSAAMSSAADPPKTAAPKLKLPSEDFVLQGEYAGTVVVPDGAEKVGVQIIALGKDKFRAVGYPGGLPGDGWNGETRIEAEGQLQQPQPSLIAPKPTENTEETKDKTPALLKPKVVRFGAKGMTGLLKPDGTLTIQAVGKTVGTLKKVVRKSKTLGEKPPKGAVVLFDGTSADKFQGGKLTKMGCSNKV